MKKIISVLLACIICLTLAVPAFAYDYEFSSGADSKTTFGKATGYDEPVTPDPLSENSRRNKDAALLPPPYGIFSGNIPTDASSLYHDNLRESGFIHQNQDLPTSGGEGYTPGFVTSTSTLVSHTEPQYYANGSIGTLYVTRTGKTITVYEGETLENLKKGAGHFSSTSVWDGNVALCGHNRGSYPYFSFVKDMRIGDTVTFTTKYGSREYEVYSKEQIGEYDHSKLGWSSNNILTLITCIEDTPEQRWCAQLREVK